ncbi:MAG: MFS transporter [Clostridia bacterium]|nr:MFS transporter [Clostridia bacterium]
MSNLTKSNVATYTKKELAGYLTGLAGQNIIYNIIATGLAFYFQSVIFLPAIACSLIFALARVWDAVNDPMMGTIVDKTRTKWGKCKPYLLFVPAVIMVTTILPFINNMYAEPNDLHEVALAEQNAYVAFADSDLVKEYEYDGVKYYMIPAGGSWDLQKDEAGRNLMDEDGNIIKTQVMVYTADKQPLTDTALAETVLQDFQNEEGFVKKTGGKAVFIIAWAAISYVLWGMTYTIGDIPLWGVTSLMTESQEDRAKALTLARAVANVGMIGTLFTMIAPAFQGMFKARGMDEAHSLRAAYIALAIVMTIFASVLFQVAGLSVKEKVAAKSEKTYSIRENFRIMFGNKPFRQILISGILRSPIQLLAIVAMTLVMYYFFNNDIGATLFVDGALNVNLVLKILILVVGLFGGMIGFPLFVPQLIGKFEKKKLYNFFSLIGAIPFALIFVFFLISKGNVLTWVGMIVMSVLFFMAGASMGSLNVLQSVMIADCVDYEEYHTGVRPDGVFFSGQSFITKLSAGIASLISGAVYAIVGFSDKNVALLNNALVNGADFKAYNGGKYAAAMFFLISIPPAVGMVLAAMPTLKYALPDGDHKRMLAELIEKRHGAEAAAEVPAYEEAAPLADEISDTVDTVETAVEETAEAAADTAEEAVDTVADDIADAVDTVETAAEETVDEITDAAEEAVTPDEE